MATKFKIFFFVHTEERAKLKKLQLEEKKKNAEFRGKVRTSVK